MSPGAARVCQLSSRDVNERRLLAFGVAVVNASIGIATLSGASAGGDLDAWVNQMLSSIFVLGARGLGEIADARRQSTGTDASMLVGV